MSVASYSIKVQEKQLFFITLELRKMKQKGLERKGLAEKKCYILTLKSINIGMPYYVDQGLYGNMPIWKDKNMTM
jgi:hypothetical protein